MRIVYAKRTGRGLFCACRGRRTLKRGGFVPLYSLGGGGGGVTAPAVRAADTAVDNNMQGGAVSPEQMKRITQKVKNIRF